MLIVCFLCAVKSVKSNRVAFSDHLGDDHWSPGGDQFGSLFTLSKEK